MWPDRVSNQGPLPYESGTLPTALRGPVVRFEGNWKVSVRSMKKFLQLLASCYKSTHINL